MYAGATRGRGTARGQGRELGRSGLRHVLDDEPLVDRDGERDLRALGRPDQPAANGGLVPFEVCRWIRRDLQRLVDREEVPRRGRGLDHLADAYLDAGDIDPLSVDEQMS